MAEMGGLPENSTPEHPACTYLRSQLEVGLTPEQVVGAAAAVRAIASGRRLLMQESDDQSKLTMMFKDGLWMGNDVNQCEPANPPAFKYVSGTFLLPEKGLKMTGAKKSRMTGTQTMAESPPIQQARMVPRTVSVTSTGSRVGGEAS